MCRNLKTVIIGCDSLSDNLDTDKRKTAFKACCEEKGYTFKDDGSLKYNCMDGDIKVDLIPRDSNVVIGDGSYSYSYGTIMQVATQSNLIQMPYNTV